MEKLFRPGLLDYANLIPPPAPMTDRLFKAWEDLEKWKANIGDAVTEREAANPSSQGPR